MYWQNKCMHQKPIFTNPHWFQALVTRHWDICSWHHCLTVSPIYTFEHMAANQIHKGILQKWCSLVYSPHSTHACSHCTVQIAVLFLCLYLEECLLTHSNLFKAKIYVSSSWLQIYLQLQHIDLQLTEVITKDELEVRAVPTKVNGTGYQQDWWGISCST